MFLRKLLKKSRELYNSNSNLEILLQIEETNNFSLLIKKGKFSEKELLEQMQQIQYDIIDIVGANADIKKAWFNFNKSYLEINSNLLRNKIRKIENMKPLRIATTPNEKEFNYYLDELNKIYKSFSIPYYSFVSDFMKKFEEIYKQKPNNEIKSLFENLQQGWNTQHLFFAEVKKLSLNNQSVLVSDFFRKNFINFEFVEISNIKEYHVVLQESYKLNDAKMQYIHDRVILFEENKVAKEVRYSRNTREDVADMSAYTNMLINPKDISIKDFYTLVKSTNEKAKRQIETNKPSSANAI